MLPAIRTRTGIGEAKHLPEERRFAVATVRFHSVELDRSGDTQRRCRNAHRPKTFGIRFRLRGDQRQFLKHRRQQPLDSQIAAVAAFAHASIDDSDWHCPSMAFCQKVGPQFQLHQHNHCRLNATNGFTDRPREIEREPRQLTLRKSFLSQLVAGIGGCRDNDVVSVGGLPLKLINDFLQLDNLANAHGMKPDDRPRRSNTAHTPQQLLYNSFSIAAMSNHAPNDERRQHRQEQPVGDIQQPSHSGNPFPTERHPQIEIAFATCRSTFCISFRFRKGNHRFDQRERPR